MTDHTISPGGSVEGPAALVLDIDDGNPSELLAGLDQSPVGALLPS